MKQNENDKNRRKNKQIKNKTVNSCLLDMTYIAYTDISALAIEIRNQSARKKTEI